MLPPETDVLMQNDNFVLMNQSMNQNLIRMTRIIFVILDIVVLNIAFVATELYMSMTSIELSREAVLYFWLYANVTWFLSTWIVGLSGGNFFSQLEPITRQTLRTYFLFVAITSVYLYFRASEFPRQFTAAFLLLLFGMLCLNRLLHLFTRSYYRKTSTLTKRVLIIGYNEISKKLVSHFEASDNQVQVVGYCEEPKNVHELSNYPIVDTPANAVLASQKHEITDIYSTIVPTQDKMIYDLMQKAEQKCIRFRLVPDFSLFAEQPMHLNSVSGMPILSPRTEPLDDVGNRLIKRALDLVVSVLVIIFILSWLMPIISLIIWLESRGPVFFVQKRSGLNNKPFNCIKFRSMRVNGEANLRQARRDDDRLTRVGRVIRKTSLDELPQFFNVLRGDMSVVGPRPHMIKHTEDYSAIISKFMLRQFVKPGITGWAQVNGYRGETKTAESMQKRVDHDLWYMENWSLLLDIKIIFLTAYNIVRGEKNAV